MEIGILLEYQYEIRSSEQEISQFITFLYPLAYLQTFREIDRSYLRHSNRHHGYQSVRFCFKNG